MEVAMSVDTQRQKRYLSRDVINCLNSQTWEDLKSDFQATCLYPLNTTFSPTTCEEVYTYANMATLCIIFLETAELFGPEHVGAVSVQEEKKWLYRRILSDIEVCIHSIRGVGILHTFPGLESQIEAILKEPYRHAFHNLRAIESGCVSTARH